MTEPQPPEPPLDFADMYAGGYLTTVRDLQRRMSRGSRGASIAGVAGVADSVVSMEGLSADDLAQEAWLRAWRHWPELARQPRQRVYGWILAVARNLLRDRLRRRQTAQRIGLCDLTETLSELAERVIPDDQRDTQPEPRLLSREREAELRAFVAASLTAPHFQQPARALAHLNARLREATLRETAAEMGLTFSAVKTQQSRLLAHFRARRQRVERGERGEQEAAS